ncbi:unnamed protein product, partial [Urochloa humidicola]
DHDAAVKRSPALVRVVAGDAPRFPVTGPEPLQYQTFPPGSTAAVASISSSILPSQRTLPQISGRLLLRQIIPVPTVVASPKPTPRRAAPATAPPSAPAALHPPGLAPAPPARVVAAVPLRLHSRAP